MRAAAVYLIDASRNGCGFTAEAFFTELRSGAGPGFAKPTNPMPRLRAALENGTFVNVRALVAGFILAFNAHARGRSLRNRDALLVSAGEPFPEVV